MAASIKPQKQADVLVDTQRVVTRADRGATWVSDRYACVRADLFLRVPVVKDYPDGQLTKSFTTKLLRKLLDRARQPGARSVWSVHFAPNGRDELVLFTDGRALGAMNARVWRGLEAAGLHPEWAADARTVAWWGQVRGKRTLFAVVAVVTPPWTSLLNGRAA